MRTLAACVVLVTASIAHAQPPGMSPPLESVVFGEKDETVATGLALGGMVLPVAVIAMGLRDSEGSEDGDGGLAALGIIAAFPGPAIAHWYTNHVGTVGMAARVVAVPLFFVGLGELQQIQRCARGEDTGYYCDDIDRSEARRMVTLGATLWAGSWVYDLVTARREVRSWNRARTVHVLPMAGAHTTGLSVGGAF